MRRSPILFSILLCCTATVCCRADEPPAPAFAIQFKNPAAVFPPQHPILLNVLPSVPVPNGEHLTVSVAPLPPEFRSATLGARLQPATTGDRLQPATLGARLPSARLRPAPPLTELRIQPPPQDPAAPAAPLPILVSFPTPAEEGVYAVCVKTVSARSALFPSPFPRRNEPPPEPAAQFIVLNPHPIQRPVGTIAPLLQNDLLDTGNNEPPASPWRLPLSATALPKVGNLHLPFTAPRSPIKPGKLHLLEVEYLPHFPNTPRNVEIRIEEEGSEPVVSGFCLADDIGSEPANGQSINQSIKHRVFFRPKTKQHNIRIVYKDKEPPNVAQTEQAFKFHLYQIEPDSSELLLPKPFADKAQRRLFGYVRRPADGQRFLDVDGDLAGAKRFVDQLQYGGYSGVMLGVLSGNDALYPAAQLRRKHEADTVELFAQLFDREDLTLIPAVDFTMPLPAVEQLLQENPDTASELLWDSYQTEGLTAPRYNLFHPAVQNAMLAVAEELLQRYSKHPSFGGVAVQLHPGGYAQLPLFLKTIDRQTFYEFRQSDLGKAAVFPADIGQWDGAAQARLIQSEPKIREAWCRWRTQKVAEFYHRLAKMLTAYRPDAKLYLAGSEMLNSPELRNYCLPGLPRQVHPLQLMRLLGFDPKALNEHPSCVFLRPSIVSAAFDSPQAAVYEDFDAQDVGQCFVRSGMNPGVLFDRGEDFAIPAAHQSRRRFVRQLAQFDTETFFDGGSSLPLGQEQSLYDFIAAFRVLPPVPFQTFASETSLQPITVRFHRTPEQTFVYIVNDAPFGVAAALTFSAAPETVLTELSGRRTLEPMSGNRWTVSMQPYDFVAVALSDSKAVIRSVSVHRPAAICGPGGLLEQKVQQLAQRIHTAQGGTVWDKLENPDFENGLEKQPTWQFKQGRATALDAAVKHGGNYAAKLTGTAEPADLPFFVSSPFEMPPTGRLYFSLYIGLPEGAVPKLEAVIAGVQETAELRILDAKLLTVESELLPSSPLPSSLSPSSVRWHRVFAAFDKLPAEAADFKAVQLGFRLLESGTVWIDDIVLYQFTVNSSELRELQRLLLTAGERQRAGRVSDLLMVLESYWAQFLYRYIPAELEGGVIRPLLSETAPKVAANVSISPKPKEPLKKESMLERFKSWLPWK